MGSRAHIGQARGCSNGQPPYAVMASRREPKTAYVAGVSTVTPLRRGGEFRGAAPGWCRVPGRRLRHERPRLETAVRTLTGAAVVNNASEAQPASSPLHTIVGPIRLRISCGRSLPSETPAFRSVWSVDSSVTASDRICSATDSVPAAIHSSRVCRRCESNHWCSAGRSRPCLCGGYRFRSITSSVSGPRWAR